MAIHKSIVFLNFRYSERVVSESGSNFDRIAGMRPRERFELLATLQGRAARRCGIDDPLFKSSRFTGVMRSLISTLFGRNIFHFETPGLPASVRVAMEGENAGTRVEDVFACFSSSADASGVEGDDLVFCIVLGHVNDTDRAPGGAPPFVLSRRPKDYQDAIAFLELCAPALTGMFQPERFSQLPIPGFYLLPQGKWQSTPATEPATTVMPQAENAVLAAVGCYLFYCWLMCQRAERLLNQLSFEGERDMESRKLILTRKKTVAALRFANVKNRAEPGSATLSVFHGMYASFRLQEQLSNLVEVSEEFQKTISLQENYLASAQIANIQWILFVFTILSVGVAFNALPVPPFVFSGTKNVLLEPGFWIVFGFVVLGAFGIWAVLHFSGPCRRTMRRILGWIFNRGNR